MSPIFLEIFDGDFSDWIDLIWILVACVILFAILVVLFFKFLDWMGNRKPLGKKGK